MKKSIILSIVLGLALVGIGHAETTDNTIAPQATSWYNLPAKKKHSALVLKGDVSSVTTNSITLNLGSVVLDITPTTKIQSGTNTVTVAAIVPGAKVRATAERNGQAFKATLIQIGQPQPAK